MINKKMTKEECSEITDEQFEKLLTVEEYTKTALIPVTLLLFFTGGVFLQHVFNKLSEYVSLNESAAVAGVVFVIFVLLLSKFYNAFSTINSITYYKAMGKVEDVIKTTFKMNEPAKDEPSSEENKQI